MKNQRSIHDPYVCEAIGCDKYFPQLSILKSHYDCYHKGLPFPLKYRDELDQE